jgi:hypothetical protein
MAKRHYYARMTKHPRLIKEGVNRKTGTFIQLDFGLNEEGQYQVTCYGYSYGKFKNFGRTYYAPQVGDSHGYYANFRTLKAAMAFFAHPDEYCPCCQEVLEARGEGDDDACDRLIQHLI